MRIEKTITSVRVARDDGTELLNVQIPSPREGWPDSLLRCWVFDEAGQRVRWNGATFEPFGPPADADQSIGAPLNLPIRPLETP